MYVGLSIAKELYCGDVVAILRRFLSDSPLLQLRKSVLFLLGMITDLSTVTDLYYLSSMLKSIVNSALTTFWQFETFSIRNQACSYRGALRMLKVIRTIWECTPKCEKDHRGVHYGN